MICIFNLEPQPLHYNSWVNNEIALVVFMTRYVTASTAWFNGAFNKMSKAGQAARSKTREKFHMAVSNLSAKVNCCFYWWE